MMELITAERPQFLVYIAISLAVTICTAILYYYDSDIYEPFFGRLNPPLVVFLISLVGLVLLSILLSRGWFSIYLQNFRGLAVAGGLALLFAVLMILVDSQSPLPEDINRPLPQALFFYPTIAFVVEILFHVLPLTLLLLLFDFLPWDLRFEKIIWPTILLVALLEPFFQLTMPSNRSGGTWLTGFITLHIFLINFTQLALFKRYDFVTMYSFRLVYYLFWHIIWGVLRLRILF
jgi:hypothetical protein